MKIVKAEVFVTCPGRNFVTLKITTDDGLTGIGDATLNGRELPVASYLKDHVCPQLIGRDAHRIEDIWQFFYKGAYWRRGPVTMSAISAVDMALWDIKAKAANMPLYQLLGGASREGVMVYCHTTGHSLDDVLEDYAKHKEHGFKAIRVQCGVPGMKTTYGMSKGKGLAYEPATKGNWPEEQLWSTENISISPRSYLPPSAIVLALTNICCTTCIIASRRSKLHVWQEHRRLPSVLDGRSNARRKSGMLPFDPPAHGHTYRRG